MKIGAVNSFEAVVVSPVMKPNMTDNARVLSDWLCISPPHQPVFEKASPCISTEEVRKCDTGDLDRTYLISLISLGDGLNLRQRCLLRHDGGRCLLPLIRC